MFVRPFRLFWLAIALIGVTACSSGGSSGGSSGSGGGSGGGDNGGGGDPPDPPDPLNIVTAAERTEYEDVTLPDFNAVSAASVAGGLQTPFGDLPTTTGATTYDGYLQIIVGGGAVSANVIGDASVQVSFQTQAIAGSATGFLGYTQDANMTEQLVSYEGTVDLTNGNISTGFGGASAVDMSIDGTLDNGLNVFVVSGEMVGGFFGANAEGLRVRGSNTSIDGNMTVMIDGTAGQVAIGTLSTVQAAPPPP